LAILATAWLLVIFLVTHGRPYTKVSTLGIVAYVNVSFVS